MGSQRNGEGVTYDDMVTIVKRAAKYNGEDAKEYSTHSFRKGGASAYMMSGEWDSDQIRQFGRWASHASMELYADSGAAGQSVNAQHTVLTGYVNASVALASPPRPRVVSMWHAEQRVRRVRDAAVSPSE